MYTTLSKTIFATIIMICAAVTASAQSKIDKLVGQLEKKSDVQVTYTENRDPQIKKITKQSTILSGHNENDAQKLWRAFEEERSNSVSITKTRNTSFIIKFQDNNYVSSYVLSIGEDRKSWSLVISKKSAKDESSISIWHNDELDRLAEFDLNGLDNLEALKGLERLEDLEGLEALKNLEKLNDLDFPSDFDLSSQTSVKVYDNDGNLIYESGSNDHSKSVDKKSKKSKARKSSSKSVSISTSSSNGKTNNSRTAVCIR